MNARSGLDMRRRYLEDCCDCGVSLGAREYREHLALQEVQQCLVDLEQAIALDDSPDIEEVLLCLAQWAIGLPPPDACAAFGRELDVPSYPDDTFKKKCFDDWCSRQVWCLHRAVWDRLQTSGLLLRLRAALCDGTAWSDYCSSEYRDYLLEYYLLETIPLCCREPFIEALAAPTTVLFSSPE